jgi:hypothetical protein
MTTNMNETGGVEVALTGAGDLPVLYRLWIGGGLVRLREARAEILWTAGEVRDWLLSETPRGDERARIEAQIVAGEGGGELGMVWDGLAAGMPRFTYRLERAGRMATQVAHQCRGRRALVDRVKSEAFREVAHGVERSAGHERALREVEDAGQRWDSVLSTRRV